MANFKSYFYLNSILISEHNFNQICLTETGTFIGNIRLEGHKPMQMPVDSKFRFGASTRTYILRERPQTGNRPIMVSEQKSNQ